MKKQDYPYKIPPVEQAVNQLVKLVFYYRLVFVIAAILVIAIAAANIYSSSSPGDQLKNTAVMITFGSVIIGIFYSILNYEHNQQRFRHDIKVSRETLTFTTSCKMHEAATILHFKNVKEFYEEHRVSFIQGNYIAVQQQFRDNPEARASFILLFNYFEGISIAKILCLLLQRCEGNTTDQLSSTNFCFS